MGCSSSKADEDGVTPLLIAAKNGRLKDVKALIAAGASVDLADDDGATPLFIAAKNGHHEIAKALIAARANLDLAMKDGMTPLCMAVAAAQIKLHDEGPDAADKPPAMFDCCDAKLRELEVRPHENLATGELMDPHRSDATGFSWRGMARKAGLPPSLSTIAFRGCLISKCLWNSRRQRQWRSLHITWTRCLRA